MDDIPACLAECHRVQSSDDSGEISDACARTIAAMYAEGMGAGQSLASTGAIVGGTSNVWRDLFGNGFYDTMPRSERILADMLGTYLLNRENDGPVDGWSNLWVR
jgi:hypothetical protein